jgi:hypothetical protein
MSSMLYLQIEPLFTPAFLRGGLDPPEVFAVHQNGYSCVWWGAYH